LEYDLDAEIRGVVSVAIRFDDRTRPLEVEPWLLYRPLRSTEDEIANHEDRQANKQDNGSVRGHTRVEPSVGDKPLQRGGDRVDGP
jgi:hypothetical protein